MADKKGINKVEFEYLLDTYPTPNHISPVTSLCILILTLPVAIYPNNSLMFSIANPVNILAAIEKASLVLNYPSKPYFF